MPFLFKLWEFCGGEMMSEYVDAVTPIKECVCVQCRWLSTDFVIIKYDVEAEYNEKR